MEEIDLNSPEGGEQATFTQLAKTLQTPQDFEQHYEKAASAVSFKDGLPCERMKKRGFEHHFKTSASSWTFGALLAFRVVPAYDVKISDVIPTYDAVEKSTSVGELFNSPSLSTHD